MQIEIYNPTPEQPLAPVEWNYSEVKQWVQDGLETYKGRVYTDDTIQQAKKDRATLNKLAQAIAAKRKEMKAMYLEPYAEFEAQAKELENMVNEQSAAIDAQVKAYEDFRKEQKLAEIRKVYDAMIGPMAELVPYERLHDPKWLNVTANMSAVSDALAHKIDRIEAGLKSIDSFALPDNIAVQVKDVFLRNFDLAEAMQARERIEKQMRELERLREKNQIEKAEQEAEAKAVPAAPVKTEPAPQPVPDRQPAPADQPLYTVAFRVEATKEQLEALKSFLKTNNIKYGRA